MNNRIVDLINVLSNKYSLDTDNAKLCLVRAVGSIINQEVIIDSNHRLFYYNREKSYFVRVRVTSNIIQRIQNEYAKEVIKLKNSILKQAIYQSRENKIVSCKVVMENIGYFVVVDLIHNTKGRLYFDNVLSNDKIRVGDTLDLKLKSTIKIKKELIGIYTRKEPAIFKKKVYNFFYKSDIQNIKVDLNKYIIVISFKKGVQLGDLLEKKEKLAEKISFKINTKAN